MHLLSSHLGRRLHAGRGLLAGAALPDARHHAAMAQGLAALTQHLLQLPVLLLDGVHLLADIPGRPWLLRVKPSPTSITCALHPLALCISHGFLRARRVISCTDTLHEQ